LRSEELPDLLVLKTRLHAITRNKNPDGPEATSRLVPAQQPKPPGKRLRRVGAWAEAWRCVFWAVKEVCFDEIGRGLSRPILSLVCGRRCALWGIGKKPAGCETRLVTAVPVGPGRPIRPILGLKARIPVAARDGRDSYAASSSPSNRQAITPSREVASQCMPAQSVRPFWSAPCRLNPRGSCGPPWLLPPDPGR